ncbi:MAG: hypothetical protein JXR58_03945 [Bacteroidales bacterium]|nr:hypothetical protein [Bacteroidales bacterium]
MRNRPEQKIDELFREAFQDFNPEPPGNVWSKIKETAAADSGSNKKGFWFNNRLILSISAVLIIAAGFSSIFYFNLFEPSNSIKNKVISENSLTNIEQNRPKTNIVNNSETKIEKDAEIENVISNTPEITINKSDKKENTDINKRLSETVLPAENSTNYSYEKLPETSENTFSKQNEVGSNFKEEKESISTQEVIIEEIVANNNVVSNNTKNKELINNEINKETKIEETVVLVNDKGQESVVETNTNNLPVEEKTEEVSHNFNAYVNENSIVGNNSNEAKTDTMQTPIIIPVKKPKNYTPSKFQIGFHYTNENLYQLSNSKSFINKSFRMAGNSWDISLNLKLNNKLSLGTGIGYTSYRENVYFNVIGEKTVIVDSVYSSSGWEYITETEDITYDEQLTNTYSFIRLPLFLRYKLAEKERFSFHLTGGVIFSQIMDRREKVLKYPGDINVLSSERITPYQSNYSFLLLGGVNVNYKLSNFVTLGVDILAKRNLTNYYEITSMEMETPYSIGAGLSLYFNF